MQRRIEMQVSVRQFNAAIGLPCDFGIMRDHQNRVAGIVQLAENVDDDSFVGFVEVAGGLVSKNQLRLIDQSARDGYPLLLATGKLRGQMREAVAEAHAFEGFFGLFFVRDAVKILRKHYVFERGQIRHQMELLKNEAYFSAR